jgi:hypothetical protein
VQSLAQMPRAPPWTRRRAGQPQVVSPACTLAAVLARQGPVARRSATAHFVAFFCALSVSIVIFMIREVDRPCDWLLRISNAPLLDAVAKISR